MNKDLSQKLLERYDYLFRDPETGKLNGLMGYGFACEDGWYNILASLCEELSIEIIELSHNKTNALEEIEAIKNFLNSPRMSESQAEKRTALVRKAKKAERNGDKANAAEIHLSIKMLDEALERLANDEFKRLEDLQENLKKIEAAIAEAKTKAPKISQVKEKFATLRVYGSIPEHKKSAVRLAERLSARTCEQCGAPGKRVVLGYLHATLCTGHAEEKAKERLKIFGNNEA